MRPIPGGRKVLQSRHRFHDHGRQRIGRSGRKCKFASLFQNNQRHPGMQPIAIGRCRREEPGKIRRVEFDAAQIVRLEIHSELPGLGADDHARIDPDHIARPEQIYCRGGRQHQIGSASALHIENELHVQAGAAGQRSAVGIVEARCNAASRPGFELVLSECRRAAHAATSCAGMICKLPVSVGLALKYVFSAAFAPK